jgi:hypothetical protein
MRERINHSAATTMNNQCDLYLGNLVTPAAAEDRAAQEYPNAYAALPSNTKGVTCPHTGLRHAHLAKLLKPGGLAAGHVRVIALRIPGARHGKTLYHVGDMLRWLDGLAAEQARDLRTSREVP